MRWVHFYGPLLKKMWKKKHKSRHQSWRMDETYLKIKGTWYYLYRAIDSYRVTLDFSLRKRRDFCSSYQFIKRLINNYGTPNCLVTDKYGATLKAIRQSWH
ncbi:DDE-type integrase/transposase/recombinase [Lactobacillus sp. S2-2]|nr:DDE-type integrase/transposase/recombinase [Lactobacillus sp. S2-2]